ncbi:MAG: gliding motility-associated C-terminal domain-containing protein [Flavobacteriales bacterium]
MSMKDSVNNLFQQRFQGHEAPVDARVWEGIQQQLTAAAPAADGLSDLFRERFQGHESPVDPSTWTHISSQLGHSAAAGGTGAAWAWVAAAVTAVVVTTTAVLWEPSANDQANVGAIPAPTAAEVASLAESEASVNEAVTPMSSHAAERVTRPATATTRPLPTRPSSTAQEVAMVDQSGQGTAQHNDHKTAHADRGAEEKEGPAVVSEIISGLEEQVKLQPFTAEPEPGINTPVIEKNRGFSDHIEHLDETKPAATFEPISPAPLPKLFMPNTFTPNGDGVNDTYMVEGDAYVAIFLRVYSLKSNALVFSTNSGEPWTGEGCEDGMYMVAVEAHTAEGRTSTEGKVVWLNRNRIN